MKRDMGRSRLKSAHPEATMARSGWWFALFWLVATLGSAVAQAAGGFDSGSFRSWVSLRVGDGKQPVYWYATGTVYAYPSGEPLLAVEGIETARLDPGLSSATEAHQLSRKIFIYRDLKSGAMVREWRGQPLPPIAYPYQYITYALKGQQIETWVEQGKGKSVVRIGPGSDMTARRVKDTLAFSAVVFLDFPLPNGERMQSFEHYDFLQKQKLISWIRYGDLPAGIGKAAMHMLAWRVSSYADVPASLRDYIDAEASLWRAPPLNLAEIRDLQK
jgi:hypothetical protein